MDSDKEATIAELEAPRFQTCSFFPYSLNEESNIVLLMRNKKMSKNPNFYVDFGTSYKESDPCIFYSACRSYIKKCAGLCFGSNISILDQEEEVLKIIKETCQRTSIEIFDNDKVKSMMSQFVKNQSHVVFDVICESHLAIFYPLPYFELEIINSVMSNAIDTIPNASKYQDVTFNWITIKQISDPDFNKNFLTAFDYQIICRSADKLTGNLIGDQSRKIGHKYADFAVI